MKRLLLLLPLLALPFLTAAEPAPYAIVFIHIGPSLPAYSFDSIQQAHLFNPHASIYLLAHQSALDNRPQDPLYEAITMIPLESLHITEQHAQFVQRTALRPGFWRHASERFLYLHDFMEQFNMTHVVHLENDVMLYADISGFMPIFREHYPNIAAVFDNDNRCIPSLIYIAHKEAMRMLAQFFADHASSGYNDMEMIAKFKHRHDTTIIDHLPIIMPSYKEHYELVTPSGHRTGRPDAYSRHFEQFKSIFDAAALGQYLGGTDPYAYPYPPGFINESCLFNPSHMTYDWQTDEQGRLIPWALFKEEKHRINTLHIHVKKLKQFASQKGS